jgi:formamidopyrimidine-DNA glycosylase
MPELPEVEITRRKLAPHLLGRKLANVRTTAKSYFFVTPPDVLSAQLTGRTAVGLTRHGKYLLLELDDASRVLLHLGMTGQLFFAGSPSVRLLSSTRGGALTPETQQTAFKPDAHTHIQIELEGEPRTLYFRDARKFGKVQWLAPGETCARLEKLGVDALSGTAEDLQRACAKRRCNVKTLLLDQSVLAGVGNIYADEALFLAGIRPRRSCARLSKDDCMRLLQAVQQVLLRSIETGGSSISDYMHPDGGRGSYQDERHVYGREGQPCKRCKTTIKRIVIGQRSSCYCATCQA